LDDERGYSHELVEIARTVGIKLEVRAPDTPAQLGMAERAGNVLVTKARAFRIEAGLPKSLTDELLLTAARITNATPTKALRWGTPYEVVFRRQPSIAHFEAVGTRGYILNKTA
jgi:hypothetical protein